MVEVTVIIPVRNGRDYVTFAVESVLNQSYQNIKLIVSDNGSSDGTIEILRQLQASRNFAIVQQDGSLSMFEHFNLCLGYVESPYYMLLCHDDLIGDRCAIAQAVSVMKQYPDLSAIYSNLLYVDEVGRAITKKKFNRTGLFNGYEVGVDSILSMRNQYGIPLLASKNALGQHRYQVDMPYVADVELSIFLASQGSCYQINEYLIENRYHQSNSTKGLYLGAFKQMKMLAKMYSIRLGVFNRLRMFVVALAIAFAKYIFFKYLVLRGYALGLRA